ATPDAIAKHIRTEKLHRDATGVRTVDASRFPYATPSERQAAGLLSAVASLGGYGYYYGSIPAGLYEQVLSLLVGSGNVYHGTETTPLRQRLDVYAENALRPGVQVDTAEDGIRVAPVLLPGSESGESVVALSAEKDKWAFKSPAYLLTGKGKMVPLPAGTPDVFAGLIARGEITVPEAGKSLFVERYLLPLAEVLPISGNAVQWEDTHAEALTPVPRLYLTEQNSRLSVALRYAYGPQEYPFDTAFPPLALERGTGEGGNVTLKRVRRDPDAEGARYAMLSGTGGSAFGLKRDDEPGHFALRARVDPVDFLLHYVPKLAEAGYEVYGDEQLQSVRVNRNKPKIAWNVSSGIDWFDLDAMLTFGDTSATFGELKRAIRRREKYVKLADGSIGVIPPEIVERFRFLFALGEETKDGGLRLSSTQSLLLEQAMADEGGDFQADAAFYERREKLHGFETIHPVPLPNDGLIATLYPYQKAGFDWLHFLHEYGFGGCLADEMGLGKSLQALCLLLSLRKSGGNDHAKAPDIIVAPKSLMFNWEREAARFTPALKILVYTEGNRSKDPAAFDGYDVVLTTYGIMLRDIEHLRKTRFHYAVLDEAQAIKNPASQSARAARLLNCEHRLTLTGTPVENGTMELWSQFAFLNPGHLGGMDRFREEFTGAIERQGDEVAAQTLRKLIAPFLLRRTKEQVAPQLPPRTEQVVYCEMDGEQRKRYEEMRDRYRAEVLGILDEAETDRKLAGRGQMKMLEALLRLRQVCNHPRLADPSYEGESAKFGVLMETIETLRAENHKALVFSQFVKMLDIIRAELDARGIPYVYLDGSTKDRQTPVDRFQNDAAIPLFLISLKAGGVGLNLTAADYVLHVDPWWNPAAERQATDRAHRIGQDKPVFVQKFLTRDTVEEKILALQERKRAITEQLITAEEGGFLKTLTRNDIEGLFT
ncbi:MAG: SNF2 helicase associated domain-containing protein, partial [Akkermansiaceae bacterium]|nr:SNF2 helicase associated domain-containing protein [Armatimonadota bacterium]